MRCRQRLKSRTRRARIGSTRGKRRKSAILQPGIVADSVSSIVENAQDVLGGVNMRLLSFAQTLEELNGVHQAGSDVFGEMFLPVPQEVVSILTPELSDDEETDYTSAAPSLSTPTDPLSLVPLGSFARKLENLERSPAVVDSGDRSTLDASLPLAAFNALHELDQMVDKITRQILDLRRLCEDAEEERKAVKQLYDSIAGNVGTTYPEASFYLSKIITWS